MTKAEKLVCDFVYIFIDEKWDKIEYDLTKSSFPSDKSGVLDRIKKDPDDATWFIMELAAWGMDKEPLLTEIFIEQDNMEFSIIKINWCPAAAAALNSL